MSEATEVPMVCVDCGGVLTDDDMISIAPGDGIVEYEHMNYSQCIASLNERITFATKRAEAAEAERDALRKDAALLDALQGEHERFDPVAALVVKVKHDRNGSDWANVVGNVRAALTAALAVQP